MDYLDLLTLPETALVITLLGLIFSEVCYSGERLRLNKMTALSGLGVAFIQTLVCYKVIPATLFSGVVILDGLSLFVRLFLILLSFISVLTLSSSKEIPESRRSEFVMLILGGTLSASLLASASDLVLIYLSLLVFMLIGGTLAAFGKSSVSSTEAGFKFLAFGTMISVFFLFGAGVLFSHSGNGNLMTVHQYLVSQPLDLGGNVLVFGFFFLVVSALLGIFPMHFWLPDVLQGAPTPVSSYLSVVSRLVGFAFGTRLLLAVFASRGEGAHWSPIGVIDWSSTLALFAGASFILGGLLSVRQSSAKRLVAYLIMVEGGYLLLGMMVLDPKGIAAGLYSLIVSLFASTGVYFVLGFFRDRLGSDELSDLRQATRISVPGVLVLVFFLVCLVGLPPLPGFVGKFTLIGSVIQHERFGLALTAIGATALSTVAVVRLALVLVGDFAALMRGGLVPAVSAAEGPINEEGLDLKTRILMAALLVPLALLAVQSDWVLEWSLRSITVMMSG